MTERAFCVIRAAVKVSVGHERLEHELLVNRIRAQVAAVVLNTFLLCVFRAQGL